MNSPFTVACMCGETGSCILCKGTGKDVFANEASRASAEGTCGRCRGSGRCITCHGSGRFAPYRPARGRVLSPAPGHELCAARKGTRECNLCMGTPRPRRPGSWPRSTPR